MVVVRRPLAALANPNFRLYVFGQIVSQSGAWMQRIAQAWLVLDLTDSPVALGTLAALQFLPILVFSLFAGVLVDRLPKRRFLMALQLGSVTQATLLAVLTLTGTVQLWQIYALALLLGAITAFDNPTRQTFVSEMVEREQLQSAVAINASVFNFGRIAGPAVGGVIVATGGAGWCFAVNAVSYFAVLGALALMRADRLHPVAPRAHATVATELLDGLRYVRSERRLTIPLVVQAFMGVFGWNFSVILPLSRATRSTSARWASARSTPRRASARSSAPSSPPARDGPGRARSCAPRRSSGSSSPRSAWPPSSAWRSPSWCCSAASPCSSKPPRTPRSSSPLGRSTAPG